MRFGHWRGVTLAIALFSSMATGRMASADGLTHTLPDEVLARDLNTGEPYMAPPIPWGHYAKDGLFDHFYKKPCFLCGLVHRGKCASGLGGGGGTCRHGLLNHCKGSGHGCGDPGCGDPGCGGHGRRVKDCGLCKGKGCGFCRSSGAGEPFHTMASAQAPAPSPVVAAPQAVPVPSPQCSEPGCSLGGRHQHGSSMGDPCDGCGGRGCGKCHGLGRIFGGHGCGSCGGRGCGKCGGGNGCGFCGGRGCGKCMGGLGSHIKGKMAGLFHHNDIKYFVGPGGPVPLTPGYVPYVVPTRSPRDFLAFPPYTPSDF